MLTELGFDHAKPNDGETGEKWASVRVFICGYVDEKGREKVIFKA